MFVSLCFITISFALISISSAFGTTTFSFSANFFSYTLLKSSKRDSFLTIVDLNISNSSWIALPPWRLLISRYASFWMLWCLVDKLKNPHQHPHPFLDLMKISALQKHLYLFFWNLHSELKIGISIFCSLRSLF